MVWINGVLGSHQTQKWPLMEITYALYVKMGYWQPRDQNSVTPQGNEEKLIAGAAQATDHRQDKQHSYFRHREQIPLLSQLWAWMWCQGLTYPHLSGCRCRREHRRLPGCVRLQRWPPVEHSTTPHHRCVVSVTGRQAPAIVKLYLVNSTPHGTHEHKLSFNCSDMTQILWCLDSAVGKYISQFECPTLFQPMHVSCTICSNKSLRIHHWCSCIPLLNVGYAQFMEQLLFRHLVPLTAINV